MFIVKLLIYIQPKHTGDSLLLHFLYKELHEALGYMKTMGRCRNTNLGFQSLADC